MTAAPYRMRLGIPVVAVDGKARRCRFCTVVGAWFGLWVGFGAVHAQSEPYLLGPMDKLHVRVVEWQTSDGVFRDWSPINGDYAVGPSGTLSIPLIGEIEAEGRTTAEIGAQISDRLQEKLGLSDRPEAALEVAEFRPIYVSGDIQNPGAFPFAPGLTVVKTVSLAGGVRRATDQNLRVERDFLQAEGGRDVLSSEYRRLLARKARFEAELAGETEIKEPEGLADYADGAALVADEKAILLADEQRLRRQLKSLADLKGLLESEIASLAEKKKPGSDNSNASGRSSRTSARWPIAAWSSTRAFPTSRGRSTISKAACLIWMSRACGPSRTSARRSRIRAACAATAPPSWRRTSSRSTATLNRFV